MLLSLHRCKFCGTRWLLWPDVIHGGGWNLLDKWQRPGSCCDNVAMGDQIEHLRDFDVASDRAVHPEAPAVCEGCGELNGPRYTSHLCATCHGISRAATSRTAGLIASPASQLEVFMPMMSGDEALVRELKDWLDTPQRDGGGVVAAEGLIRRIIPVLSSYGGAKLRAYRQARVFEPSMDGYAGAMATYSAAFGKPEGEIGVLTTDGEKQPWELAEVSSPARPQLEQLIEAWRYKRKLTDRIRWTVYERCADELEAVLAEGTVSAAPPALEQKKSEKTTKS